MSGSGDPIIPPSGGGNTSQVAGTSNAILNPQASGTSDANLNPQAPANTNAPTTLTQTSNVDTRMQVMDQKMDQMMTMFNTMMASMANINGGAVNTPGYPFQVPQTGTYVTPPPTIVQNNPAQAAAPVAVPQTTANASVIVSHPQNTQATGLNGTNTAHSTAGANGFTAPYPVPSSGGGVPSGSASVRLRQSQRRASRADRSSRARVDVRLDDDSESEGEISSVSRTRSRRGLITEAELPSNPTKYDLNSLKPEIQSRSLSIKEYTIKTDWPVWVQKFEVAVDRATNPHSKARHYRHCLDWLSLHLEESAHTIWQRCVYKDSDWAKLKEELEDGFEDPKFRDSWKTDPYAYKWEDGVPLQTYYSQIIRFINKYDIEIRDHPPAQKVQYYKRFLNGLPDDYRQQVHVSLTTKKEDISRAMEICKKFQSVKEARTNQRTEIGAATTFREPEKDRIKKLELDMAQMDGKFDRIGSALERIEKNGRRTSGYTSGGGWPNRRYPSESNEDGRDKQRNSGYSSENGRVGAPGYTPTATRPETRDRNFTSNKQANEYGRDRLQRFKQIKQRRRFNSRDQEQDPKPKSDNDAPQNKVRFQNDPKQRDESYALATEIESGNELDDTVAEFARVQEEREADLFLAFRQDKYAGNLQPTK